MGFCVEHHTEFGNLGLEVRREGFYVKGPTAKSGDHDNHKPDTLYLYPHGDDYVSGTAEIPFAALDGLQAVMDYARWHHAELYRTGMGYAAPYDGVTCCWEVTDAEGTVLARVRTHAEAQTLIDLAGRAFEQVCSAREVKLHVSNELAVARRDEADRAQASRDRQVAGMARVFAEAMLSEQPISFLLAGRRDVPGSDTVRCERVKVLSVDGSNGVAVISGSDIVTVDFEQVWALRPGSEELPDTDTQTPVAILDSAAAPAA